MIWPLPRTGPSSRCRLQLTTKMRLSSFSRAGSVMAPSDSGSSVSPSPRNAHTFVVRRLLQPAIFQVADEPRLVDRHDGAEPHRHRRIFPEIGHQPRMRIRRQAAARRELAPEIVELFFGETAFEERARVDAGRRVSLVIHDVAIAGAAGSEEMIEADLVQRRRRRERRDMSADAGLVLVRAQHHRDRVPADEALDAALDLLAAGKRHFLLGRQRVDVRRVRA